MKKNTRIVALVCLLVVVVTAGGAGLWYVTQDRPQGDANTPGTSTPNGEPVSDEPDFIYTEQLIGEGYNSKEAIVKYGDRDVAVVEEYENDVYKMGLYDVTTWEKVGEQLPPEIPEGITFYNMAFDKQLNACSMIYDYEQSVAKLIKYDKNGKIFAETPLEDWHGIIVVSPDNFKIPAFSELQITDEYIFVQSTKENYVGVLQVFTLDGKLYWEQTGANTFRATNDKVYFISGGNKYINCVDLKTKNTDYSLETVQPVAHGGILYMYLPSGSDKIYGLTLGGVQAYNRADGKPKEDLFNLSDVAVELGDITRGLAVDEDGNIYISDVYTASDESTLNRIFKYSLTENTRKNMDYTLTVTTPYRDDNFESIILKYEKENPDQKIKYDYAFSSVDEYFNKGGQSYYDKLTLQILTGEIGDLVMFGDMDRRNLMVQDIFANIKPLLQSDPSYPQLNKKIIDGLEIDGEIRGIPLNVQYSYVEMNTVLAEEMGITVDENTTWGDILNLIPMLEEKYPDCALFSFGGPEYLENLFVKMLIDNMPDLIDLENKTVDLNQQWFTDLMKQWKQAVQSPCFSKMTKRTPTNRLGVGALFSVDLFGAGVEHHMGWMSAYNEQEGCKSEIIPRFRGEQSSNRVAYVPAMYGINSGSKNKEAAWGLMSYALSEAGQAKIDKAFPVNDVVMKVQVERGTAMTRREEYGAEFGKQVKNIADNVDYSYDMGYYKEDLYKPLLKYLDGSETLEQALDKAEKAIWIRLNE